MNGPDVRTRGHGDRAVAAVGEVEGLIRDHGHQVETIETDHGVYTDVRTTEDKLVVDLLGEQLDARFAIFQTGGANWIAHLVTDDR